MISAFSLAVNSNFGMNKDEACKVIIWPLNKESLMPRKMLQLVYNVCTGCVCSWYTAVCTVGVCSWYTVCIAQAVNTGILGSLCVRNCATLFSFKSSPTFSRNSVVFFLSLVFVCACVRACVCACMRACVRARVFVNV